MSESKRSLASRRSFLRAVGAAAAALPFYRLLENNVARADGATPPLKFVGVGLFHATSHLYHARRAGETDTQYDLSYADCVLRPFDDPATYGVSFKDELLICEGFDYACAHYQPGGQPLVDAGGQATAVPMHGALGLFLTGSSAPFSPTGDWRLQNPSLDQYLAEKYGGATRFRSVQLTNETDYGSAPTTGSAISFGTGGAPLSRMTDPQEIWDKYFAGLMPTDAAAAAKLQRKRASVLDAVTKDLTRLNGRLAGAEKQKLDQHLTAVRELERQLTQMPAATGCVAPARHSKAGDGYVVQNQWNGGVDWFDRFADWQLEMLAQILICDLSRFGTIVLSGVAQKAGTCTGLAGDTIPATSVGDLPDRALPWDFHNEIAHRSGDDSPAAQRVVAGMMRYYMKKLARFMKVLHDAGALDSTLIMVGNEGGHGAGHSTDNVPILLAGGANGKLRLGRRLVAPGKTAVVGDQPRGARSPHNPLLVGVANAFGETLTSYGTSAPSVTAGVSGLL